MTESPRPPSVHQSLGYWTSLIARTMEANFNKRLARHGITRAAWAVLAATHFDGKTNPSDLASFLSIDRAAITRLLDKLEMQGLVRRDRTGSDRRSVTLSVTAKGAELAAEVVQESQAVNAQFTAGLSPQDIETYLQTIRKMLATAEDLADRL